MKIFFKSRRKKAQLLIDHRVSKTEIDRPDRILEIEFIYIYFFYTAFCNHQLKDAFMNLLHFEELYNNNKAPKIICGKVSSPISYETVSTWENVSKLAGSYVSRCVWKTKDEGIDRQEEERLEEGAVKPESRARAAEGGRRSKTATSDCASLWRIGRLRRATAINRSPPGNCPRTYPTSGLDPRRKLFRYSRDDVGAGPQ